MTKVISRDAASWQSSSRSSRRFNLKFFNIGLFGLIVVLGFCYLINISDLTVKGFVLQELKTKANYLAAENLSQKEAIDKLQSYFSLSAQAPQLDMVAVGEIEYLTAVSSAVAKK